MNSASKPKLPPGPKGNLLLSKEVNLQTDILNFIVKQVAKYNGISRSKLGFNHYVNISNPDYIEHVFQHRDVYVKGRDNKNLMFLLGNGLLTSQGEFWMKQRRLMQPLFHKQRLNGFVEKISECTHAILNEWQTIGAKNIDAHAEMTKLTLEIVSQTLMSTKVEGDFAHISEALEVVMKGMIGRTNSFLRLPYWLPIPKHIQMKRHRKLLDDTVLKIIAQRRKEPGKYNDLLTMLLEVEDADTAERMTDEQVRDEVITIFLAGHETTANALSFAFYLLAKHPDVQERVRNEALEMLKSGKLSYESLNKLTFTTMVIKEAMRMFPPAWAMLREVAKDDVIDGYLLKKGDGVVMCAYAVQRSEKYWSEPDRFIPERFSPENQKHIHRYAYFPFGGGARLCIGNNFAMMEMQIILALICSEYVFELPADYQLQLEPLVTLRPKNGVRLNLNKTSA